MFCFYLFGLLAPLLSEVIWPLESVTSLLLPNSPKRSFSNKSKMWIGYRLFFTVLMKIKKPIIITKTLTRYRWRIWVSDFMVFHQFLNVLFGNVNHSWVTWHQGNKNNNNSALQIWKGLNLWQKKKERFSFFIDLAFRILCLNLFPEHCQYTTPPFIVVLTHWPQIKWQLEYIFQDVKISGWNVNHPNVLSKWCQTQKVGNNPDVWCHRNKTIGWLLNCSPFHGVFWQH